MSQRNVGDPGFSRTNGGPNRMDTLEFDSFQRVEAVF